MSAGSTGKLGEMAAADYLRGKGYRIICANYRTRMGEIDLIASDGTCLVFAEVKTRAQDSMILPREAVDGRKQRKIIRAAESFLAVYPTDLQPRFDVIEVIVRKTDDFQPVRINHIENAFTL